MLRSETPPASRRRPVQADVRPLVAGLLAAALATAAAPANAATSASAGGATAPPSAASPAPAIAGLRAHPGETLYVLRPIQARTRGGGNLAVDLLRGQAVRLIELRGDALLLSPGPADAEALRALGVRRAPRYTVAAAEAAGSLVDAAAWGRARDEGVRRARERWPDLDAARAESIFLGRPFTGMSVDQAEEAVGGLVLSRARGEGPAKTEIWSLGSRPRASELRAFNEKRERAVRARSFDEYLEARVRAVLTFRDGTLVTIEAPESGGAATARP